MKEAKEHALMRAGAAEVAEALLAMVLQQQQQVRGVCDGGGVLWRVLLCD